MTVGNRMRAVVVGGMVIVMLFALASNAFATTASTTIEGPMLSNRVTKTVDLVPGDTITINQEFGKAVVYTLVNEATNRTIATARNGMTGFSGAVSQAMVYKNKGTLPLRVRVEAQYADFYTMKANFTYSLPAVTTQFATAWQSYTLPTVSVAPGRTYTCVLTAKPVNPDTLFFGVNGIDAGSVTVSALGPVWSYTNTGSTAVNISVRDTIDWRTMTVNEMAAAGSLAGTLYY